MADHTIVAKGGTVPGDWNYAEPTSPAVFSSANQRAHLIANQTAVLCEFADASARTGGQVFMSSSYAQMPMLRTTDGNDIFLYKFVEAVDEALDYESVRA